MKQIQENLTVLLKLSGYILEGCNLEIIWEMDLKFWYVILKGKISGNMNIYWCFEFYTNLLRHNSKKKRKIRCCDVMPWVNYSWFF